MKYLTGSLKRGLKYIRVAQEEGALKGCRAKGGIDMG
jgi:hypothetical protein